MNKKCLFTLMLGLIVSVSFAKTQQQIIPTDAQIKASDKKNRSALNVASDHTISYGKNLEILFQQTIEPVGGNWNFLTSDANSTGPYYVADNFYETEGTITEISFFGLDLSNPWAPCDEDPMTFDIIFYEDDEGNIGDEVASYEVTIARIATGAVYAGYPCWLWTGSLSQGVEMTEGWVSVVGTSLANPDGWFLWGNSYDGDNTGLRNIGNGWEPVAYDFAFTLAGPLANEDAPAAPSNFVVTPDAGGELNAVLTWTNPDLTYAGDPLTDLDEIRIYRDDVLIHTITNPIIGADDSWTDNTVPELGEYAYTLTAYNDAGESPFNHYDALWIGEDVPDAVENLLLVDVAGNGYLTWTNPTTGLHGGAFHNPITGYHIIRSDGATFEVTDIATDFTDSSVTEPGNYSYSVQTYNITGDGGIMVSNTEWLTAGFSGVLIIDLSSHLTGEVLQTAIENNYGGIVALSVSIDEFPITDNIDAIFMLVGVYPNNYTLQENEVGPFKDYITGGGNFYIEGGDNWGFGPHTTLNDLLNISCSDDGAYIGDLANVTGSDFLEGMSWYYSGENCYIDHLVPTGPSTIIFTNTNPAYDCGIANNTGTYKTVGVSFEITGLDGNNSLDDAVEGILEFFEIAGQTVIDNNIVSTTSTLGTNYPNPFNQTTTISFSLTTESTEDTEIIIYNLKGKKIRQYSIFNLSKAGQANQYTIIWDGTDNNNKPVSGGVYFYQIKAGKFTETKKMMLIK